MTQPNPTPGAPVDAPALPSDQTGQAPAAVPPWERDGGQFDPERAWKLIESLRAENTQHKTGRQTAEQTATQAQERLTAMLKAAGISPDGTETIDPEEAAAALNERAERAEGIAFRSAVESQMYRHSGNLGADVEGILDSNRALEFFSDELDKVEGITELDPGSKKFAAAVEQALAATLEEHPRFKQAAGQGPAPIAPRADPSQGARGNGPTPFAGQSLTSAIAAHYQPKR